MQKAKVIYQEALIEQDRVKSKTMLSLLDNLQHAKTPSEEMARLRSHIDRHQQKVEWRQFDKFFTLEDLLRQVELLKSLLPVQYTQEQLTEAIAQIIKEKGARSMRDYADIVYAAVDRLYTVADETSIMLTVRQFLTRG